MRCFGVYDLINSPPHAPCAVRRAALCDEKCRQLDEYFENITKSTALCVAMLRDAGARVLGAIAHRRGRVVATSTASTASRVAGVERCRTYASESIDALTSSQRATRRTLLALTTACAGAYISYFTVPLLVDGSARSCAALVRSNDGFLSRTGVERARALWWLGDVARAREALIAAGVISACVDVSTRGRSMELAARERASALLATATEDERGVDDVRSRARDVQMLEDARARWAIRRRTWRRFRGSDGDDAEEEADVEDDDVQARRLAATRANVALALERVRARDV